MAEKITQNSWFEEPGRGPVPPDCAEEIEELEKFHAAGKGPVKASEAFKTRLKNKLWRLLKDKYYLLVALLALVFS